MDKQQIHELLVNDTIEHLKDEIVKIMRDNRFSTEDRIKIFTTAFGGK